MSANSLFSLDQDLKTFFENNYNTFLDNCGKGIVKPNEYLVGYPNPAKYQGDIYLYVFPVKWDFAQEGMFTSVNIPAKIYMTIKKQEDNYQTGKDYLRYFFDFILNNKSLGGLVDIAYITHCEYYDGIEGADLIKAIEIELTLKIIQ